MIDKPTDRGFDPLARDPCEVSDLVIADAGDVRGAVAPSDEEVEELERLQFRWTAEMAVVEGRDTPVLIHAARRELRPTLGGIVVGELVFAPAQQIHDAQVLGDDAEALGEFSPAQPRNIADLVVRDATDPGRAVYLVRDSRVRDQRRSMIRSKALALPGKTYEPTVENPRRGEANPLIPWHCVPCCSVVSS